MRLTGQEFTALEDALRDAYPSYDDLGLLLAGSGQRIADIAAPGPMRHVVAAVLEEASRRDRVHELLAAARADNPTNKKLLIVAAALGLEPGGVPPGSLTTNGALAAVTDRLERMVNVDRGIKDLGSFAAKIQELLRRVCAVELGDEFGSGFLIGEDTILTNYHVVEPAIDHGFAPANIRVRFDYQRLRDGLETNAGVAFPLADDWLVHAEKYSVVDTLPYEPASLPDAHELDYAVLRTREKVGLMPPSGPVTSPRGWIAPRAQAFGFAPDSFLMIVQYPCHDPISFDATDDGVKLVNANGTRVQYRNNTMPGSSGSPVLDRDLGLVALHHSGEPGSPDFRLECHQQVTPATYNEGIPIAKIQADLAGHGLSAVFGGDLP